MRRISRIWSRRHLLEIAQKILPVLDVLGMVMSCKKCSAVGALIGLVKLVPMRGCHRKSCGRRRGTKTQASKDLAGPEG